MSIKVLIHKDGHVYYKDSRNALCEGKGEVNLAGLYGEKCRECCEITSNLLQGMKLHEH